ncbi:hypothetical protein FACS1894190_16900 [Spirochaetia bacterium]|nr:hypothetical protein FACS1894190_16900 [Spirochaetia bacterium]
MTELKEHRIKQAHLYLLLFLIAFVFVFSSAYSPFNFRRGHVDSVTYTTITQGISRGQVPYKDFVDNKGPLMYFLNVPGFILGGFTGIWVTELILMYTAVFFAYKTALFFCGKYKALLATACSFAAALAFFTASAGTEEYSLPFLMIPLYIFTKYYFSTGQERNVSICTLIVLGICFASAISIRLDMFPLWAGFCTLIFFETIIKRRFALLCKYILGFCAGIIVVLAPIFLYLKMNGIMDDFVYQVILGGASRGFGGVNLKQTVINFYIAAGRNYSFIPLLWGVFSIIKNYPQKDFIFQAGYTFSYFIALLFFSFSGGDSHFNLSLIPFFVPPIAIFVKALCCEFAIFQGGKRNLAIALFLCIVFSEGLMKCIDDFLEIFTNHSGGDLIRAGRMIDENTKYGDKIISLGSCYIYPFTQRPAASKFINHGTGVNSYTGAREEFLNDVLQNKPAIIITFLAENDDYLHAWYKPIYEMIERDYHTLDIIGDYVLFSRN